MTSPMPPRNRSFAPVWLSLGAVAALAAVWWLSAVTLPLAIGLTMAFVLAPAVERLAPRLGGRARAAALLIGGFVLAVAAVVAIAVPMLVDEARHWSASASGEGRRELGNGWEQPIDYGKWADPDADEWQSAALVTEAQRRGAPMMVVKALASAKPSSGNGEVPLSEAVGDRDGDGVLDPGYARRWRALTRDRNGWAASLAQALDKSGISREFERWRRNTTLRSQLSQLSQGEGLPAAEQVAKRVLGSLGTLLAGLLTVTVALVLIPFYAFAFLLQLPRWRERAPLYLPASSRSLWMRIGQRIGRAIAGFVRGRLFVCALVGLLTGVGWLCLGVRLGLLMGLAVGALTMVPLVNVLALVPVLLMSLLEVATGTHGWGWFAAVVAVYVGGQVAESVLNPIIVGDAVQLDMLTIVVAFFIGGAVAGAVGLVLAVPVAATLRILADELVLPRWRTWAGQGGGDADASETPDTQPPPG